MQKVLLCFVGFSKPRDIFLWNYLIFLFAFDWNCFAFSFRPLTIASIQPIPCVAAGFSPPPTAVPAGPPRPALRAVAAALPVPVPVPAPLPRKILRPPGKPQAPSRPTRAPRPRLPLTRPFPPVRPSIPRRPIRRSDGQSRGCMQRPPGAPRFLRPSPAPAGPPSPRSCGPIPGTVLSWGSKRPPLQEAGEGGSKAGAICWLQTFH